MDLQQLRYFAAVARLGNFTRAAESCGVTQPTLSQQIAKLELELGRPLFHRLPRGADLTDAGRAFRDKVEPALGLLDAAAEDVTTSMAAPKLTVAAIPTVAPYLLPGVLVKFAVAHPEARVELREYTTDETLARLAEGELDLAVLAQPLPPDETREHETLFSEELMLAMPTGHMLAKKKELHIADLAEQRFVVLHEMHCLSETAASFCARHALAPLTAAKTHQLATVLELVRLGAGVSLVPAMAAAERPGVEFRSLHGDKPLRTLCAARSRHRLKGRLHDAFVGLLKQGVKV
jgi:LysR family transcriptional regulator, hydrogen peroxide-inducible genes activator